jgi:4-hydroxybenzoate polyprenyltransferase
LAALIASLRPHQWSKNLLVFAALGFTKHLFEPAPLLRALLAFAVFCALSGVVYLVNDLADVERDRLHPRKRRRPIASGELGVPVARGAALGLGVASLAATSRIAPRTACQRCNARSSYELVRSRATDFQRSLL